MENLNNQFPNNKSHWDANGINSNVLNPKIQTHHDILEFYSSEFGNYLRFEVCVLVFQTPSITNK